MTFPEQEQIKGLSTPELYSHFSDALEITAKHLVHLGHLWLELEDRGEDLSDLKKGLAVYIPMIAHNRIDAKLVVAYAGQKTLLSALSNLSTQQQILLIDNATVKVVNPESKITDDINLSDLGARQIAQIFTESRIRPADEQLVLINHEDSKPKKTKKIRLTNNLSVVDDWLIVSNHRVDLDKALEVLSAHYEKDLKSFVHT